MKKYDIIYADPPWKYRHCASNSRRIENQYPTMSLEEIKNMEIPAKEDCLLYLWTTAPKLGEAVEVIKAWGFDYRTCMIWDKDVIGMGYWFRGQHELLLVAVKGNFSPPKPSYRVSSILKEKRGQHSKKPDVIRNWINSWYPDKSKIELFARQRFQGWDTWGNEVPSDTQLLISHNSKGGKVE